MRSQMRPKLIPAHKPIAAPFAPKRPIRQIAVRAHVLLERVLLRVHLAALGALVLDAQMRIDVPIEVALLLVAIRAVRAFVRLLAGMRAPVQYQIGGSTELFVAVRTLDRFAGVQRHVRLERRVLRKGLGAEFAFVRFLAGVDAHVALERVALCKLEAALVAVVGPFTGVRAPVEA